MGYLCAPKNRFYNTTEAMNREELFGEIIRKRSFLCVGLDTDIRKVPACVLQAVGVAPDAVADAEQVGEALFRFNRAIVDATAPYCVAYKPNLAFYEAVGVEGIRALERTVRYIRERYPEQFIIADAKRGDIGNTSQLYARSFFEQMDVDAVTVAPYMGEDSVRPFLGYEGKWVVCLALTSNKGSHDFQLCTTDGTDERLFERVLRTAQTWGTEDQVMFVVGATQGAMFSDVRRVAPHSFLLVPGVGAQGGSLQEVVRYGMNGQCGLIVNSSRAIIYASAGEDFAEAAAGAARQVQIEMAECLENRGLIAK